MCRIDACTERIHSSDKQANTAFTLSLLVVHRHKFRTPLTPDWWIVICPGWVCLRMQQAVDPRNDNAQCRKRICDDEYVTSRTQSPTCNFALLCKLTENCSNPAEAPFQMVDWILNMLVAFQHQMQTVHNGKNISFSLFPDKGNKYKLRGLCLMGVVYFKSLISQNL